MSHSAQYLSCVSVGVSPLGVVTAKAAGFGETECMRMCRLRLTFLSALYEQCVHVYCFPVFTALVTDSE